MEVVGAEPAGPAPGGPGPQVLDALRPMMREVVLSGTATALAGRGEVYGKTGTAEFGSNTPPDAHGWFMGYRSAGRRATSRSPSWSRAVSPAAPRSPSPTPSSARWAEKTSRPKFFF